MRQTADLPQPVINLFRDFLVNHPPQNFSPRLRRLLLDYMARQVQTGLPIYFGEFLRSLSDFFDLLDEAAVHQQAINYKENKNKDGLG